MSLSPKVFRRRPPIWTTRWPPRAAARDAWAHTPIHERGAVLIAAAAVVDRNAEDWGLELAIEEGKTSAEGIGEVRRAAQILRYYGNEGDRSGRRDLRLAAGR